ncbi:uncharacterized protein LOC108412160 [Pygocentrus nattereri]|uniref:uncharacterized protein LOC108412160 n=1 Tax=Pygocentrus nattereri TaxID=42514 RepID=UPI0008148248|nr:uncharacterized protein LOC108412160 [Pygocentrus nattereri]
MNILLLLTLCRVSDAWSIEHLTAVLGETVTISCNYPEKFKSKPKCLAKRFDDSHTIVVSTTEAPKGRFSISDDRRSNTISVNIINVTQEDSGDYSCKVMKGNTLRWIYLEIIARPSSTLKPTTYRHTSPLGTTFTSKGQFTRSSSTLEPTTYRNTSVGQTAFTFDEQFSFAIITACFFIALILLGGLFMMKYRQRQHKTHAAITRCVDSACRGQKTTGGDDENDPPRPNTKQSNSDHQSPNSNMSQSASLSGSDYKKPNSYPNQSLPVYQSTKFNNRSNSDTSQSDSDYENPNPYPNQLNSASQSQSDSVYQSPNSDTSQSDSDYEDPNSFLSQSLSAYQSPNSNTKQSDSVYKSPNSDTSQSDSDYENPNPYPGQSLPAYQSPNSNTNQSDSVYQSLDPKTKDINSVYHTLGPRHIIFK